LNGPTIRAGFSPKARKVHQEGDQGAVSSRSTKAKTGFIGAAKAELKLLASQRLTRVGLLCQEKKYSRRGSQQLKCRCVVPADLNANRQVQRIQEAGVRWSALSPANWKV